MNQPQPAPSIVVGIDGSDAATNAAKWAAVESSSRNLPLRLVHVVNGSAAGTSVVAPDLEMQYAETVLCEVDAVLRAGSSAAKVETAIVRGSPSQSLIDESRDSALVCVGSLGIGRVSRAIFGSTATELAYGAHCPVAIVRAHDDASRAARGWIAVAVDHTPGNDLLLKHAFREAQLRHLPLLALEAQRWQRVGQLDHRIERWASRYPDVRVRLSLLQRGLPEALSCTGEPIALAVLGKHDVDDMTRIVGPVRHDVPDRTGCSVLVVRD
ncbi:MAG: universal stress protein [Mycobacterium sp.]